MLANVWERWMFVYVGKESVQRECAMCFAEGVVRMKSNADRARHDTHEKAFNITREWKRNKKYNGKMPDPLLNWGY